MAHHIVHVTACLLMYMTVIWAEQEQTRWSRQISSYTADISDWVPLPGPMEHDMPQTKRQAVAEPRILSEPFPGIPRPTGFTHGGNFNQDSFPFRAFFNTPANRQLYLQSLPAVPSAPQNYLTEQGFGQSIRFGLSQPNFPLTQGFVAPQLNFDNIPSIKTKPQQVVLNPIKFENFPKSNPSLKPQVQTFITQAPKSKPEVPKFLDGYRVENISNDFNNRKPQSLQKLKYDGVKTETINQNKPKVEREEVQLLYVPLESLNKGQFKFRNPIPTPQTINMDLYNQVQRQFPLNTPVINNPSANFQKTTPKTVENLGLRHEFLTNGNAQISTVNQIPQFSTLLSPFPTLSPSTLKPKKLKPHQPPLAIFLTQDARKDKQVKVGDVLYSLKNANTIAVLDSINPQNAPKVFIGPSTLTLPDNYVKFELPYLSNIENSESKLRQLPFFVAPLSYNTPQGFAKIPFPSPHVGSVVINSQIQRDTQTSAHLTTLSDILPSFYPYSLPPSKQGKNLENSKPKINYYTTVSPKTKVPSRHEPNNYAFEKQTVNSLHTPKETATGLKETSYFLNNVGNQYNPSDFVNFPSGSNYQTPETVQTYTIAPIVETTSTQKPTTTTTTTTSTTSTTTTTKPSTYPSQLLETHNPYSINQAFHFSTPIDYQNFFDEYKENYSTPGNASPPQQSTINISSPTPISQETERPLPKYTNRSPNYLQGYTPEIHYDSEVQNHFFHNTNQQTVNSKETSEYTQTENPLLQNENFQPSSDFIPPRNVNENIETEQILAHDNFETLYTTPSASSENPIPTTAPTEEYNYYETNLSTDKNQETISSTSTTTSTTRRTPLRSRGHPRYPTVKPDTGEYTTKTFATRRPLRERRPLASRPRYESNQITTEKPLKKPAESIETTTKYMRTRTRGRIHYKPSDADEIYEKRAKTQNGKENDLAYQRDVLHQNYPVTLMERMSTVDIEAITEPIVKAPSTSIRHSEDTENAYSNDKVSITEHIANVEYKDLYEYRDGQSNSQYIPNLTTTSDDDYIYKPRSSISPSDAYATFDEVKEEKTDHKLTTPVYPSKIMEVTISDNNEFLITQNNEQSVSANNEYETIKTEQTTTKTNVVNENVANQEKNRNADDEENIVQTTPSYNRVRIRPGVIRQNHQASKESHRARGERRRPGLAVTYRPAYDKRRTTMRIDEIEADLKTKQIHSRPDFQDYRHPVYKPEPTTEPTIIVTSTQEASTKRGLYRRRRPTYTTSSTEIPTNKKNTYEIKSHFRGRRPTEKQSEKPKVVTESPTATVRETSDTKYNDGTRLSERFNKNSEQEELADQDPNYSIQKSNYAKPESDRWSPKFSKDSFKPYNPNDIVDETKMQAADHSTANGPELDIITAKNEYDNILISVTPATNNRANKKIPDIPPTLEALVEQSRITKSNGSDTMSTFESMLEEVMKSLEEQDEDEYTKNVMKHKGGEIGEIPPEKIIESAENYYSKPTTSVNEITTISATSEDTTQIEQKETDRKTRRRGFWKKVKVRPSTTESIEVAESQYYSSTANRLGQPIKFSKAGLDKSEEKEKSKLKITTYKPSYQFIQELFETDNDEIEIIPDIDIPKITTVSSDQKTIMLNDSHLKTTAFTTENTSTEKLNPGELDLGTGSPDLTFAESTYFSAVTEPTSSKSYNSSAHTSDGFSLMDYLFGVTSSDSDADFKGKNETKRNQDISLETSSDLDEGKVTTEQSKFKTTTETTYIPDEITAITLNNEEENEKQSSDKNKLDISKEDYFIEGTTEQSLERIETTSISSFMDSLNIVSTSMSTEVSHETEICFRGKCIKTKRL